MLQIVIYKKLNFWEEYTPLWLPLAQLSFLAQHMITQFTHDYSSPEQVNSG